MVRTRSWYRRLDRLTLFVLVPGSLIIIILWALLAFFWAQSIEWAAGKEPWTFWDRIVRSGWASRFTTICTAVMRSIMSLQASILTAMVAALVLEVVGVPMRHAPYYSTVRALYPSPFALLKTAALGIKNKWTIFTVGFITIETMVVIASQFLSTIYLSDLSGTTVLNNTIADMVPVTNDGYFHSSPWTMPLSSSRRFAEISESFTEGLDFHDTGHTYRAFLPFSEDYQRLRLREYFGPVQVMDQRVVCVSPTLTNMTLYGGRLQGRLKLNKNYPMLINTPTRRPVNFDCQMDRDTKIPSGPSLCYPQMPLREQFGLESEWPDPYSSIPRDPAFILVFDDIYSGDYSYISETIFYTEQTGPWSYIGNGTFGLGRVTACNINFGDKVFTMRLSATSDGIEPSISWDKRIARYNTDQVRRQLSTSSNSSSAQSRGVMSMQPRLKWQDAKDNDTNPLPNRIWLLTDILKRTRPQNSSTSITPNSYSVDLDEDTIHGSHVDLFLDTLKETGSPALAIQSLFARLCSILYYDYIATGTLFMGPSHVRFSTDVLMPVVWSGFIGASCIVAIHMLLMLIVMVCFFKYTNHSVLGNHWQALAQAVSVETAPILFKPGSMVDKDVEMWAKYKSLELKRIVKLREGKDGRMALITEVDDEELMTGTHNIAANWR